MIGTNKMILNDATIQEMVQKHINEHVVKEEYTCIKVDKEYSNNTYQWIAYFEPKVETK